MSLNERELEIELDSEIEIYLGSGRVILSLKDEQRAQKETNRQRWGLLERLMEPVMEHLLLHFACMYFLNTDTFIVSTV